MYNPNQKLKYIFWQLTFKINLIKFEIKKITKVNVINETKDIINTKIDIEIHIGAASTICTSTRMI
jgi:hypothetical protein